MKRKEDVLFKSHGSFVHGIVFQRFTSLVEINQEDSGDGGMFVDHMLNHAGSEHWMYILICGNHWGRPGHPGIGIVPVPRI